MSYNYLVLNLYRIGSPSFELLIDEIHKILNLDKNNKVKMLTCFGVIQNCSSNLQGSKIKCEICKLHSQFIIKKYSHPRLEIIDIKFLIKKYNNHDYNFNKLEKLDDIKSIIYKNINIGTGVVSTYVSYTRNIEQNLNLNQKKIIEKNLIGTAKIIDALDSLNNKFDNYLTFNGRFSEQRAFFNYFKNKTDCIEFTKKSNYFEKTYFKKSLPHNIDNFIKKVDYLYNSEINNYKKLKIGKDYFTKKINNTIESELNYTHYQKKNLLPENFDFNKRNIVFFISSEDEIYSIGGKWENKKLFKNQIDFCNFFEQNWGDNLNLHLYVRIHPSLKKIRHSYITNFEKFNKGNISIIKANSKISTYSLLKNSNLIITTSSSIGVEANFFKKPVIQVGTSFYSDLEIAYKPKSLEELKVLINRKNLTYRSKLDSIKYGYFFNNLPSEKYYLLPSKINYLFLFDNKIYFQKLIFSKKIHLLTIILLIINRIKNKLNEVY